MSKLCKAKVFLQGKIYPSTNELDILFVGSFPGQAEAVTRLSLVGSPGELFQELIQDVLPSETSWILTNALYCVPWRDEDLDAVRSPTTQELKNCKRLHIENLISITQPKRLVAMGKLGESALKGHNFVSIPHPLSIVASSHPDLEFARASVTLKGLFK